MGFVGNSSGLLFLYHVRVLRLLRQIWPFDEEPPILPAPKVVLGVEDSAKKTIKAKSFDEAKTHITRGSFENGD